MPCECTRQTPAGVGAPIRYRWVLHRDDRLQQNDRFKAREIRWLANDVHWVMMLTWRTLGTVASALSPPAHMPAPLWYPGSVVALLGAITGMVTVVIGSFNVQPKSCTYGWEERLLMNVVLAFFTGLPAAVVACQQGRDPMRDRSALRVMSRMHLGVKTRTHRQVSQDGAGRSIQRFKTVSDLRDTSDTGGDDEVATKDTQFDVGLLKPACCTVLREQWLCCRAEGGRTCPCNGCASVARYRRAGETCSGCCALLIRRGYARRRGAQRSHVAWFVSIGASVLLPLAVCVFNVWSVLGLLRTDAGWECIGDGLRNLKLPGMTGLRRAYEYLLLVTIGPVTLLWATALAEFALSALLLVRYARRTGNKVGKLLGTVEDEEPPPSASFAARAAQAARAVCCGAAPAPEAPEGFDRPAIGTDVAKQAGEPDPSASFKLSGVRGGVRGQASLETLSIDLRMRLEKLQIIGAGHLHAVCARGLRSPYFLP